MLIRDIELGEFGYEGIMDFPLFDCEIEVHFDEDITAEYAEKCAAYLSTLNEDVIEKLCEFSIGYCEDCREHFDECDISISDGIKSREILQYIRPNSLLICTPQSENIAFHLELNCDWEEEHGMEWTINNGEVLYVGAYSDESPWLEKEHFKNASWNYAIIAD